MERPTSCTSSSCRAALLLPGRTTAFDCGAAGPVTCAQATITSCQASPSGQWQTPSMTYVAAEDRYEKMPYRRCGRSGIELPAISLGLWQNFGDDRPLTTQRAIVRRAFDLGVTHFDLANNYGGIAPAQTLRKDAYEPPYGSAEINFGRILRED